VDDLSRDVRLVGIHFRSGKMKNGYLRKLTLPLPEPPRACNSDTACSQGKRTQKRRPATPMTNASEVLRPSSEYLFKI